MKKQEMCVCDLDLLDMTVLLPASILPCLSRSLRTAGPRMDQTQRKTPCQLTGDIGLLPSLCLLVLQGLFSPDNYTETANSLEEVLVPV